MNTEPTDFGPLAAQLTNPASLITNLTDRDDYFHDATEASGQPQAIVLAKSETDVIATIDFCRENGLAVVARGAGTGLSGGCVPVENCIVLSTERMIDLEIDSARKRATCDPGVITKDLLDAASKHSLTFPPDPASFEESTIGGNVAENAGGLRCKRFGVIKDYVIGLRAVLADGSVIETGVFNQSATFALHDLLIGSEGTLAIITKIAVQLIPTPSLGTTILVAFDNPKNAAQTVADIVRSGMILTVMEYLDGDAADCSNQYEKTEGLDRAAAILLLETTGEEKATQTTAIKKLCLANNCTYLRIESDPAAAEHLWAVRRNLSLAIKEIADYRISEDVAVPISRFPILVSYVADLNHASMLRINGFGHAGDGNLHVTFMAQHRTPDEMGLMKTEIRKLLEKAIQLGGTLTGEHGIGLAKREYLHLEFDRATLDLMKSVKLTLDPTGLLNPGKIFS